MKPSLSPHIKHLRDIHEIIAGDQCYLKEIFHPERDQAEINFSLAWAYINAGGQTLDHYLLQSETYYIIKGKGIMTIDDQSFEVEPGLSYLVPPESHQSMKNTGGEVLEFLVIVAPPWNKESEFITFPDRK